MKREALRPGPRWRLRPVAVATGCHPRAVLTLLGRPWPSRPVTYPT